MSLDTWIEEYMPEPPETAAGKGEVAALLHSIRKWDGFRRCNLDRHGVTLDGAYIHDGTRCRPMAQPGRCALCYCVRTGSFANCTNCPVSRLHGLHSCASAYSYFVAESDPGPMLRLLLATLNSEMRRLTRKPTWFRRNIKCLID